MHLILALLALADATIITADNQQIQARDVSIVDVAGVLTIQYKDAQNRDHAIKCEEVVEIVFGRVNPARKFAAEDVVITTGGGDTVYGAIAGPGKESVRIASRVFGEIEYAFLDLKEMRFLNTRTFWPKKDPEFDGRSDLIVMKSGDRSKATLEAIEKASIKYTPRRSGAKSQTLPLENAAMIFFMLPRTPKAPTSLHAIVTTSDGSSVQGVLTELKAGVLTFKDLRDKELKVSAASLASLFFKNGKVVYISDMAPTKVEENANFIRPANGAALPSDLTYPWQVDKSAAGTKLSVRGKEFRKGIGVRARSSLTYDLGGKFKKLQSSIGIDDCLEHGDVVFEVWVDGALKFKQPAKSGDAAVDIEVDVSGAKELRLVVDFGGNANIGDFADWGSARLIK